MASSKVAPATWADLPNVDGNEKSEHAGDIEMGLARPLASVPGSLYEEQTKFESTTSELTPGPLVVEERKNVDAEKEKKSSRCSCSGFSWFMISWEAIMVTLFCLFVKYNPTNMGGGDPTLTTDTVQALYPFFQDVHVMIFIGFGFLMTFLRRNGYMSLGLNFLVAAFAIQWYILASGFWESVFGLAHSKWSKIEVSIPTMIKADFSAGAVLITYGALLGKVSPLQLSVVTLLEVIFFALNEAISLKMEVADIGGAMVIHMFGAFFGLACSFVLGSKKAKDHPDNAPSYHADLFSMIGTVFLWMYWPSFNGALGTGNTQQRAIFNTLISLTASCMTTFVCSSYFRGHKKFEMVDIQNATLAGGVAMGTCADMIITPGGAMAIGVAAGIISSWGFTFATPFFENKLKIHDTCGVLNLHGLPGLAGATAGIIASRLATFSDYGASIGTVFPARGATGDSRTAFDQAIVQLEFMFITLGIAIVSGLFTGVIVAKNSLVEPVERDDMFSDATFFGTPAQEIPYYFGPETTVHSVPTNKAVELEARMHVLEKVISAIESGNPSEQAAKTEMVFDRLLRRLDNNGENRMEQLVERIVMRLASVGGRGDDRKHQ